MKKRIAALIGDFYHKAELMRDALSSAAKGREIDAFTNPADFPWDALGGYGCVVVSKEGRINPQESTAVWFSDAHHEALARFVSSGGGLVVLHSGLASYGMEGRYGAVVRGAFQFHPQEHPLFRVRSTGVRHPVMEGFQEMELQDEMYFVRIDSARTTRLLETYSPDYGSSTAAWAHQEGEGRVFCFTPGHTAEVLADPGWQGFVGKGIRWVFGEA
jgi:type 1 glutamine amidotransferase